MVKKFQDSDKNYVAVQTVDNSVIFTIHLFAYHFQVCFVLQLCNLFHDKLFTISIDSVAYTHTHIHTP